MIFFLCLFPPHHREVSALKIIEVSDTKTSQVPGDTNSQLFQGRKQERKPDHRILLKMKCPVHSPCGMNKEMTVVFISFSSNLSINVFAFPQSRPEAEQAAKGERDETFPSESIWFYLECVSQP